MSTPQLNLNQAMLNRAEPEQWRADIRRELTEARCATIAKVTAFDTVKQVVTVQILISELVNDPSGPVWKAINPILNVPICLPRGGGFCLTLPLVPGDEGLLVFCDSCIDLWWQSGGIQPPPGGPLVQNNFETRRHDLADCGFYPSAYNQTRVLSNYSANSAQLRSDDDSVIVDVALAGITLTAPKVTINSTGDIDLNADGNVNVNGTQISIDSSGNDTEIDGVEYLTHTHSGVQTGGSDTGPVVP